MTVADIAEIQGPVNSVILSIYRYSQAKKTAIFCFFLFSFSTNAIVWYDLRMAITKRTRFSRRVPDHVTDEIVNVLGDDDSFFGFNDLFEAVYARLKERNAVSGGEEMLRLRAYEKLQNLVTRGMIEKEGKEYKGLAKLSEAHSDFLAAQDSA